MIFAEYLFLGLSLAGMSLGLLWVIFVIYLKHKWLLTLEEILEEGRRYYSLSIFLSGPGTLHYATIFLSSFQAKRYGLLEKRNNIPKPIQKLFISSLIICLLSFILMASSYLILEFVIN
jgi:hypothetical protein